MIRDGNNQNNFVGIKLKLTRSNDSHYFVSETTLTPCDDECGPPSLQEAPDFSQMQKFPRQMPNLVPAPAVDSGRKRRHSEYYSHKELDENANYANDDFDVNLRKRARRSTKESHQQEFMLRQQEIFEKLAQDNEKVKAEYGEFRVISNIAYAMIRSVTTFKCNTVSCNYKTRDDKLFLKHLKRKHNHDSWLESHEFCKACRSRIGALSLEEEFQHMMSVHVVPKDSLEGLIDILDGKEVSIEEKSDDKDFEAHAIISEPQCFVNDDEKKRFEEIELQMMELFESKKKKIEILCVEKLPNIDALELIGEAEDIKPITNPPARRPSVIVLNARLTQKQTSLDEMVSKQNDSGLDLAFDATSSYKNDFTSKLALKNNIKTQNVAADKIDCDCSSETKVDCEKPEAKSEADVFKHLVSNIGKDKAGPTRRALSIDEPALNKKMFKRSLSLVRSRQSSVSVNIEINKSSSSKTLSPIEIDELLHAEKSVLGQKSSASSETQSVWLRPNQPNLYSIPECLSKADESQLQNYKEMNNLYVNESLIQSRESLLKISSDSDLMPWIDRKFLRKNSKYEICYKKMLTKSSICALFKCMSLKCSFTTNEAELFLNHLIYHEDGAVQDGDSFHLLCSYCPFKAKNRAKDLAHHVEDLHRSDIYQCEHCFYRSREKENCYQHIQSRHKTRSRLIYECFGPKIGADAAQKICQRLIRKRCQNVVPIVCKLCDDKYFVLEDLLTHLEGHGNSENPNELKVVREMMRVLEQTFDTHAYGMLQCLYCVYGAATEKHLREHLVEHPSEPYFCCIRKPLLNQHPNPFSIDSTTIFQLKFEETIQTEEAGKENQTYTSDNFRRVVDKDLSSLLKMSSASSTPSPLY